MEDVKEMWYTEFIKGVSMGISESVLSKEGVIAPTALYEAEARGTRSAEGWKVNVHEMKCLRNLVGVAQMDRVRDEEVNKSWNRQGVGM